MHRSSSVYKQKLSETVLNKYVGGFCVRGQQMMICVTEGSVMDYGITFLARSNSLNLKHLNDGFVSYKHAAFL